MVRWHKTGDTTSAIRHAAKARKVLKLLLTHPLQLHRPPTGAPLTREEANTSYVVIRHNVRTYQSAGVVEVIKGKQNAEAAIKKYEEAQGSSDRHEGWRYFLEKTEMKPGTDPTEATHRRQTELDNRETKAQLDTDALVDRQKASR